MAKTTYYSMGGRLIGESTGGVVRNYITDALGSVVGTAVNGAVENTYQYKPYGGLLAKMGTAGDPSFLWNGRNGYRATKLPNSDYYVRNRVVSSNSAQWTTVDPLWPGQPPFGYGAQSPSTLIDPSGMTCTAAGQGHSFAVKSFAVTTTPITHPDPVYLGNGEWSVFVYIKARFSCHESITPCLKPQCIPVGCPHRPMQQWKAMATNLVAPSAYMQDVAVGSSIDCGCANYSRDGCSATQKGADNAGFVHCSSGQDGLMYNCDFSCSAWKIKESDMCQSGNLSGEFCQVQRWFSTCCDSQSSSSSPPSNCQNDGGPLLWGYKASFTVNIPGKSITTCLQMTDGDYPGDYTTPCQSKQ